MKYDSPHYNGKIFLNPVPTEISEKGAFFNVLKEYLKRQPNREPTKKPGPFLVNIKEYENLPEDAFRITWMGHSTILLEMDGKRFLTDPVWYQRASPFTMLGPKRFFDAPISLQDLPPVDVILLSHDHYDHLDKQAIIQLTSKGIPVICTLGVGGRLIKWGVDQKLITELDWWQQVNPFKKFTITLTPARHFSGRWIGDRYTTLWAAFAVQGPYHSFYYGADSGLYEGFKNIGEQLGPFDVTMLNIGAYNENWAAIHMTPEEALEAHLYLNGKLFFPIHWGTFNLAIHSWTEPVERIVAAATAQNIPLLLPTPGQIWNIQEGAINSNWWKEY